MYLPVAMETVLPAPNQNAPRAGYIGTLTNLASFENSLNQFVTGSDLNGYFYDAPAGMGWPQFNLTPSGVTSGALIKIPGGANVFAESAATSIYKVNDAAAPSPSLTSSQQTSVTNAANDNYAVQEITDLFFGWADFYEEHQAELGDKYIAPNKELAALLKPASDAESIQAQDGIVPFKIRTAKSGAYDEAHALKFATLVWKAMWIMSKDDVPKKPGVPATISYEPRYIVAKDLKFSVSTKYPGLPIFPALARRFSRS